MALRGLPRRACLGGGPGAVAPSPQGPARTAEQGRVLLAPTNRLGKEPPEPGRNPQAGRRGRHVSLSRRIAAANFLGFTTQSPARGEVATSGFRLPRKLLGSDTVVHTRRPEAWKDLSEADAALLDFLRLAGRTSELSPEETVKRALALCREQGRFERLLKVASSEPPRVRAMLGAIGAQIGKKLQTLKGLRESLNPVSRFDFGMLQSLAHARDWQAKGRGATS